jgi:hypothetical protein
VATSGRPFGLENFGSKSGLLVLSLIGAERERDEQVQTEEEEQGTGEQVAVFCGRGGGFWPRAVFCRLPLQSLESKAITVPALGPFEHDGLAPHHVVNVPALLYVAVLSPAEAERPRHEHRLGLVLYRAEEQWPHLLPVLEPGVAESLQLLLLPLGLTAAGLQLRLQFPHQPLGLF